MISLHYSCTCGASLPTLDEAQAHADTSGHNVNVSGAVTSRRPKALTQDELDRHELRRLERDIDRLKAQHRLG